MADGTQTWNPPLEERARERTDAKLADVLDDIVYLLPGCPDVTIRKELARVWRRFAESTSCWKEVLPVPLMAGERLYPVQSAQGGVVKTVDAAFFAKREEDGRVLRRPAWRTRAFPGPDGWSVEMNHAPDGQFVAQCPFMELRLTLLPVRNSEEVPPYILDRYGAELASGVVATLAAQEGRGWFNAAIAAQKGIEWRDALNVASLQTIAPNGEIDTHNYEGWA